MNTKRAPKVRFKGFTDAWEQRKLEALVDVCSGRDYKHLTEGDIPVYGTGGYMLSVSEALSYDKDAIGIGRKGTIDKPYILNAPFWTVDTLFYAIPKEKVDLNFAFAIFQNINWKKKDESTGVPSLSRTAINEIHILVPQYDEQQALGQLFYGIDRLITLHQRKLDKMKELKKTFLNLIFSQKLRFRGFTDSWELRKLGEITEKITRKNQSLESLLPLTISAQHGLIDQNSFFNKQIASKDVSGYYLIKNGEFAYNKSYSNAYPWGAIKRLDLHDKGVLSTLYIVFKPTNVESNFLVSYYSADNWHKEVSIRAAEGARNHGLLNISPQDFFETKLLIPNKYEEQEKIGVFFKKLDNLIIFNQDKINRLKNVKKILLRNMLI